MPQGSRLLARPAPRVRSCGTLRLRLREISLGEYNRRASSLGLRAWPGTPGLLVWSMPASGGEPGQE